MTDVSASVKIRPFSQDDLNAVLEVQNACDLAAGWSHRDYENLASDPRGLILVAESDDPFHAKILGFSVFYQLGEEAELWNIAVAPRFRRQGVAKSLLRETLRRLSNNGAKRILLEVRGSNTAAIELYHSLGFTLLARRRDYYYNPREDALVLTRELLSNV